MWADLGKVGTFGINFQIVGTFGCFPFFLLRVAKPRNRRTCCAFSPLLQFSRTFPISKGSEAPKTIFHPCQKMTNRFGRKRLSESLSRARHQPGDDDPTPNRVLQRQHGDRDTSNRGEDAVSTLSTSQQVVCATTSLATVLLASGLLGTSMWSQSVTRRSLRANSTLHSAAGQASRRVGAITPLAIFPLCIRRNVYNALHACTC